MKEKFLGCMYGLAIGDALGAPVEFMLLDEIKRKYGQQGIRDFDSWSGFPPGAYTDDTQMSLATAVGCIRAQLRWLDRGICHLPSVVYGRYLDWLKTQEDRFQQRAPGNTCLQALRSHKMGMMQEKINNSKGCGGVMRTAPLGLVVEAGRAFEYGAECAAITHGHPTGYLTAGFLSELICHLTAGKGLEDAIQISTEELTKYDDHQESLDIIQKSQKLAKSDRSVEQAINLLGAGWVGEEALAISLYCSLKFKEDWLAGTLAAVNHSGDSDSTGSITGAILGTINGVKEIPVSFIERLENQKQIKKITDDMYQLFVKGEKLSHEEYPPC